MAIENWLSNAEKHAIATIVKRMSERGMYLGELGGDVLRIPMAKLKKAGYKFLGCDISEDDTDIEKLRASLQKLDMEPTDTDESIDSLAEALAKVLEDLLMQPVQEETRPTKKKGIRHGYPY